MYAHAASQDASVDHEAENRRLKRERIRRRTYKTREQARQGIFDGIEMFYNPKPKHCQKPGRCLPSISKTDSAT